MKLGLIGYGNIGRELARLMANDDLYAAVETTVLVRPGRSEGKAQVESIDEMLKANPEFVVEAAGHSAVEEFVGPCLSAGTDVVVASVGALANEVLRARIEASAREGGARLILPSGAIGGVDMLAALAPSGISSVSYSGRKPPAAWRGSLAEDLIDLDCLAE